ncbi:hypothetical protein LPJ59_001744, partial [Coemansia sp. RSA 2399]
DLYTYTFSLRGVTMTRPGDNSDAKKNDTSASWKPIGAAGSSSDTHTGSRGTQHGSDGGYFGPDYRMKVEGQAAQQQQQQLHNQEIRSLEYYSSPAMDERPMGGMAVHGSTEEVHDGSQSLEIIARGKVDPSTLPQDPFLVKCNSLLR